MTNARKILVLVLTMLLAGVIACITPKSKEGIQTQKEQGKESATKAKEITADAGLTDTHPKIEEGISCNECHEIKLDAKTTATQVWLTGESPGRAAGEGVIPRDQLWSEIEKIIGGKKEKSKTFVIGTSLNNTPLTTTSEFTLDPQEKVLYGFHEKGTEKLLHIKANPKVSLNWHKEFESFADFLCVQIVGRAELIDGTSKEFDRIMIEFLPYENAARVPKDATPQQREEHLKKFRDSIKPGMMISKITIDQVTVANIAFTKEGFRRYQRWTRE
jgi:nitroimidazol reductase NimA-like FMN-containing flavoprotein (pyridoxamine 5'-phosphate oxidase superfamily)